MLHGRNITQSGRGVTAAYYPLEREGFKVSSPLSDVLTALLIAKSHALTMLYNYILSCRAQNKLKKPLRI